MIDKVEQELQKILKKYHYDSVDDIEWILISKRQKLSEEFIEKHQDKMDWYNLSWRKDFSKKFMAKFKDRLETASIKYCQKWVYRPPNYKVKKIR